MLRRRSREGLRESRRGGATREDGGAATCTAARNRPVAPARTRPVRPKPERRATPSARREKGGRASSPGISSDKTASNQIGDEHRDVVLRPLERHCVVAGELLRDLAGRVAVFDQ